MLEAAFWGALSASALLIGATIAVRWRLPNRVVGLTMGFGAGAIISAVNFELMKRQFPRRAVPASLVLD
jgi:ZIP family zinc transporter